MRLTVATADERLISVEVDEEELVENVKAILEVEIQMPLAQQQLIFQGRELVDSTPLQVYGVKDGDLIMVLPAAVGRSQAEAEAAAARRNPDGSAVDPVAFRNAIRSNRELIGRLRASNPRLAELILGDDVEAFQEMLRTTHKAERDREQAQRDLLYADPFDVEAQKRIEEAIRQSNVDENYELALEHNPEVFTSVTMLYVPMEVNNHPIKAFVDSGAQMTNMSRDCAERCGLMRLVDRRFGGTAVGVGESVIIGRIHAVQLKIGNNFYPCSITVLEKLGQGMLFGLDMLRKHQCVIDLGENVLRVGRGEVVLPFLPEHECPKPGDLDMPLRGATMPKDAEASTSASQPQPTAATPPAAPAAAGPISRPSQAPGIPEEKILRLMELGFMRQQVIEALTVCNGNEEQAAGMLFG